MVARANARAEESHTRPRRERVNKPHNCLTTWDMCVPYYIGLADRLRWLKRYIVLQFLLLFGKKESLIFLPDINFQPALCILPTTAV